jgi:hypothetical protein
LEQNNNSANVLVWFPSGVKHYLHGEREAAGVFHYKTAGVVAREAKQS